MSQPKHLWSGDWEQESQAPPSPLAPDTPAEQEPVLDAEAADSPPRELPVFVPRGWERTAVLALVVLAIVAGAAWGIGTLARGSHHSPGVDQSEGSAFTPPGYSGGPAQNSGVPQPQSSGAGGHADGLGMVLKSAGHNQVVVAGVAPGSPATSMGITPGLQLVSINSRPVTSAAQANAIIKSLKLGTAVTLQLAEGGVEATAEIQEPGIP